MDSWAFIDGLYEARKGLEHFPDPARTQAVAVGLHQFLFIRRTAGEEDREGLHARYLLLQRQTEEVLLDTLGDPGMAADATRQLFEALPLIYRQLVEDADAILQSDPAARSRSEVLAAYPGFFATYMYRIAHQLWVQGVALLPRLLSEYAHSVTGIDIHPAAQIGRAFAIDHGTGIVIGETTVIRDRVKIYQGVTLGALNVSKEEANVKRHPTIEDEVVIYSGATILGGQTVIGRGSIIGGNVWLTGSIPPHSVVYHQSEIRVKDRSPFPEPLNFMI